MLTEKYINPLTDFGFKKLFGIEPNKELLIDFLNQIIPNHQIEDLTYSNAEQLSHSEFDRKAIFDLHCVGKRGERFIVEMQKAKQNFFKDRSLYYASFPIQEQAKKGTWDYQLDPIYSVGILDFVFEDHKGKDDFLHVIELKNQRCEVFYEKLKFIYIELPKFNKQSSELLTQLDKWLYVLKHLSKLQDRPEALQARIFTRLFDAAELAKFSPAERIAYEESLKYYRDIKNVIDTSKEEGREEGMEEGFEKGLEKGLEKGMIAAKIEVAKALLEKNIPIDIIISTTGLSKIEIETLL